MKIINYSTIDMAIHAATNLAKALQTPRQESPFQVWDAQLKVIRRLTHMLMQRLKSQTGMHYPPPPDLLTKKRTKIPRVEDQTAPPPRVDPDEEYENREQKIPSPIQTTSSSEATRKKYTKKLKELMKQHHQDHYTGNKYDLMRSTHW